MPSPSTTLVLFDGVCGLCNRMVQFLLRHDRRDQFRFAALQSELGQTLLHRHGLSTGNLDTIVVVTDLGQPAERPFVRSQAALRVLEQLGGFWKLASVVRIIPTPAREAAYQLIARHRYRFFGKYAECRLPRPEDRHKFVGQPVFERNESEWARGS